jgi:hypothetical protein
MINEEPDHNPSQVQLQALLIKRHCAGVWKSTYKFGSILASKMLINRLDRYIHYPNIRAKGIWVEERMSVITNKTVQRRMLWDKYNRWWILRLASFMRSHRSGPWHVTDSMQVHMHRTLILNSHVRPTHPQLWIQCSRSSIQTNWPYCQDHTDLHYQWCRRDAKAN